MSIKEFSEFWLHFVLFPVAFVSLGYLLILRLQGARQLGLQRWSLKVIPFQKKDESKVKVISIVVFLASIIFLFTSLASRYHLGS